MVPIDLEHAERLGKAVDTAAALAARFDAPLVFVGVTPTAPGPAARSPEAYGRKLAAFAEAAGARHGVTAESRTLVCHDPSAELDKTLLKAVEETGADLVVIASHIPNAVDHFWSSHSGTLARNAAVSVFVVR
jgi:nucleotide-binding universal stress UspA family protein